MIYDAFRQRKLESLESNALDAFDRQVKVEKVTRDNIGESTGENISYGNYTILGKIEIPKIGFTSVIIKEYTYRYDLSGKRVDNNYKGLVISKGKKFISK